MSELLAVVIVDTSSNQTRALELHHELGVRGERDGKVEVSSLVGKLRRIDVSMQADALPRWDYSL